jgi:prepilin-type N-terminal cleavage/methylation domain-containing protein
MSSGKDWHIQESQIFMEKRKQERGFSLIEMAVVLMVVVIVAAIAVPQITHSMSSYRLKTTTRRLIDLMHQAKTQAVADNRKASLMVDTANRRMGLMILDADGNLVRTDYVNLPEGITFSKPFNVSAPMTGAPTANAISFPPYQSSTTTFRQDFTSRGFPEVATPGAINAIYIGNGRDFSAITLTCVGGIRNYVWSAGRWENTRR